MKYVLDTSFFFADIPVEGELHTTHSVVAELRDLRSKSRFDILSEGGLRTSDPSAASLGLVRKAAGLTGDKPVISDTDCDVLALALDLEAAVYTDDFALQNIAHEIHVETIPIQQRKARKIKWKYRCRGCGRYYDHDGDCQICGAEIKRKLK
jgi:UPF0271 protein